MEKTGEKADVMGGEGEVEVEEEKEGGAERRGGRRTGCRSACSQEGSAAAAAAAAGAGQWTLSVTAPKGHLDVSGTLEHKVRLRLKSAAPGGS